MLLNLHKYATGGAKDSFSILIMALIYEIQLKHVYLTFFLTTRSVSFYLLFNTLKMSTTWKLNNYAKNS